MHQQPQSDTVAAPRLNGEATALLQQLEVSNVLEVSALAAALSRRDTTATLPAFREFLAAYQAQVLIPLEWPSILRAYGHASRNEVRELIALDQSLAREPGLRPFAAASCRVGQRQLGRLRPLRDHRLVRRYLDAIEAGQAHGWHTLVFGVALWVFHLPLRQGLLHYANQTASGFIESAARPLRLTEAQCAELQADAGAGWAVAMENALRQYQPQMLTL